MRLKKNRLRKGLKNENKKDERWPKIINFGKKKEKTKRR